MNKSSVLLVNSSPKQMYKTLHQMITSPIMPKTAILATPHKITILLKHNSGEKSVIEKCQRPVLCLALKTSSSTARVVDYSYINTSVQGQWWFHQYYHLNKSIIFQLPYPNTDLKWLSAVEEKGSNALIIYMPSCLELKREGNQIKVLQIEKSFRENLI